MYIPNRYNLFVYFVYSLFGSADTKYLMTMYLAINIGDCLQGKIIKWYTAYWTSTLTFA